MAIIDSAGLFLGDRLGWCSDVAQLHWPRLYSAANNFARLELNYRKIISKAYANFQAPPAEQEFWAMIREYKDNFLLLVYQTDDGVLWGQWQTNERYLLGHKNAEDRRSPAPPLEAQDAYRNAYLDRKKSKSNKNVELADLLGVVPTCAESCDLPVLTVAGVGVGGGEGVGGGKDLSVATQPHPEATLGAKTKHPDLLIYEAYPRKEGKGAAMQAIGKAVKRLVKGEPPHAPMPKLEAQRWLFAHTLAYARSPAGQNPDKGKIPHPSTWFNQSRYDDDQANWHHTNTGDTNGKQRNFSNIADSSRGALELLSGMDTPAYLGGGGAQARPHVGQVLEGVDGPALAADAGRDR